jgi:hypothetical protein
VCEEDEFLVLRGESHGLLNLACAQLIQENVLKEEMGLYKWLVTCQLEQRGALHTLVPCLNMTKGRFDLVASSFSAPMIIPLSINTASCYY